MKNNYHNSNENENFLFGKDKKLPFIVPDGYFDSFAARIMARIEVMDEIREFSSLSDIDKLNSYVVPANYFRTSQDQLELKCELSDFSVLSSIPKKTLKPHDNMLSVESVLGKNEDELDALKTLSSINKKNKFAVAPDYFEHSSDAIKAAVHASGKQAKVISIFIRPKMMLAYAAAIIAIVCAAFYFNSNKPEMVKGDCHTLACLERSDVLNDKTLNDLSEQDLYEMVDETQLDEQLSGSDSLSVNE